MNLVKRSSQWGMFLFLLGCTQSQGADNLSPVVKTAKGKRHTCRLHEKGEVSCWGAQTHGQLGSESGKDLSVQEAKQAKLGKDFIAVDVACGQESTCALSNTGRVKCWGGNLYGQLGLEERGTYGSFAGSMADNLPYVDFGKNEVATLLAVGADHTCVALKSGGVKCWGHNDTEQLGIGDRNNRGHNEGDMGDNLKKVSSLANKKIVALSSHYDANANCALIEKETKWSCWGEPNDYKIIPQKNPS